MITGIGQGYIQTTPIQLCLMTAQIANGGYKIYPQIILDKDNTENQPSDKFTPLYYQNIVLINETCFYTQLFWPTI